MSNRTLRRAVCSVLLLPILTLGTPVSATVVVAPPSSAAEERARGHFSRGVSLFEDGDFDSALFEFESAYELTDNAHLLYNIAVSQYERHQYAASALAYRRYLAELEPELPPERVATVKERLRTLELRIGTLIVESDPPGAAVSIGGETVGVTPAELTVDLGETLVTVSKDGYASSEVKARVAGGERTNLQVKLEEAQIEEESPPPPAAFTAAPAPPVQNDQPPRRDDERPLKIGTWVAIGVTVAAAVGAGVTGSLAIGANNDLEDAAARETTREELDDLGSRRDNLALGTDIFIGVAAAAAVTSIALGTTLLIRRKRKRNAAFNIARGTIWF